MATIIGVGMQMTASAAGMTKGLSEAERALGLLQKIVEQNQQSMAKFSAEANRTSRQVENLTKTTSLLARIEIGRLLIDGIQLIGSTISSTVSQIGGFVRSVNSSLDSLNDLSARTGIGVEQLQKYAFAAKLAGVDTTAFGAAVQKLAVNIGKATPGGELDKSLRAINLSVTQLRALAPEQQFSVIGEAISRLPTAADRAAAAVAVFGKQGATLAPLFRDGAASIEELQARAERLGIIVSETQINNVADMNDAFDTVRATIEGIIGQVIGNLAPAVTTVTEQFLRFVEEWSGAQGEGGTGIANAITDVLLRGAEIFAKVFDQFVGNFSGFTATLSQVADVFRFVGNTLELIVNGFRTAFNGIQTFLDFFLIGFGKILEGLGSWVSTDLENFGRNLQEEAARSANRNAAELKAAATDAANTFNNLLTDGAGSAAAAGQGQAEQFVNGLAQGIRAARAPEVQIQTNLAKTQEDLSTFLKTATDGGSEFLQQSQETLRVFQQQAEAGSLTATQIKIMTGFAERLNAELQKEKSLREDAKAAAEAQAKADQQRIASLDKAGQVQDKISQDLAAVEREQLRVQQELNAARDASDTQRADQATARLAQLDQYQASLEEQQQAFEQGFGDGFGKVFEATNKQINDLVNKAAEFGNAGAAAAQQFQEGVARVQEQARDGILNSEAYQQEIDRQRALFERQLGNIRNEEAEKLAAAKRVDDFLKQGIDARRQAELDAAKQLEERKKQAAQNVAAIQAKIEEAQRQLQQDREDGDLKSARDGANRLRQLRGLQREEQKVADGAAKRTQNVFADAARQQTDTFGAFADAATQQVQQFNNAVSGSLNTVNSALAQGSANLEKVAREQRNSLMLGPQQIAVSDVRSAEGQQMILDAAAQYQNPQLIAMRQQTGVLRQIAQGLTQNLNRIGVPAVLG